MCGKADAKILIASTVKGGRHTVQLPLKQPIKKIKWIKKTMTKIHFDIIFEVKTKTNVKTNFGVCVYFLHLI